MIMVTIMITIMMVMMIIIVIKKKITTIKLTSLQYDNTMVTHKIATFIWMEPQTPLQREQ